MQANVAAPQGLAVDELKRQLTQRVSANDALRRREDSFAVRRPLSCATFRIRSQSFVLAFGSSLLRLHACRPALLLTLLRPNSKSFHDVV